MNHGLPAINGEKLYNQIEVNSVDQHIWRGERTKLHNLIRNFCVKNGITFFHKLPLGSIENSKGSVIVFMWLFDVIGDYDYWKNISQSCQQLGKHVLVITDNIVEFEPLPGVEFFSYPELLGITASYQDMPVVGQPSKLYNCFIQRVCPVRQRWFYLLYHYNLLDKGYVSLLMNQLNAGKYSGLVGQELFDFIHHTSQLDRLPHFQKAHRELRDQIPYRNFIETNNLLPLISDSKYSLVLETYALEDDTNRWCFTEKSLRALQFPSVPLLFLQKQGLSKLQSLGFEFNPMINAIDHLPWQERQQQLLDILIEDSVDYNSVELYNQSQHNRWLLQSWKSAYNTQDFFDNFYTKAMSL